MLVQAKNKANNSVTVVPEDYLKFNDNLELVKEKDKEKEKEKESKAEDK